VYYYRSKSGTEVDFVVNDVPVESKVSGKSTRALHKLIEKLSASHGVVFHLGPFQKKNNVYHVPVYYL